MKMELLMQALKFSITSGEFSDDSASQLIDIVVSCGRLLERASNSDIWRNEFSLISDSSLADILNELSYDIYGKLARQSHGIVPFDRYAYECRKIAAMSELIDEQLHVGYDIVRDLWNDNESTGSNKADGSFGTDDKPDEFDDEHDEFDDEPTF